MHDTQPDLQLVLTGSGGAFDFDRCLAPPANLYTVGDTSVLIFMDKEAVIPQLFL